MSCCSYILFQKMEQINKTNRFIYWRNMRTAVQTLIKNGCIVFNEETYNIPVEIWGRAFLTIQKDAEVQGG